MTARAGEARHLLKVPAGLPALRSERSSVGDEHFEWIVATMAEVLVERVRRPLPFELGGSWPAAVRAAREPAGAP